MREKMAGIYGKWLNKGVTKYDLFWGAFMWILAIAFWCFVMAPAAMAKDKPQRFYLFGDSLSAAHNSWAELLNDYDMAQIHNISRGGLRLVDITIPHWLACNDAEVIIRLGTNDAGNRVSDEDYAKALRNHLDTLQAKSCKVWLALPLHLTELGEELEWRTREKRNLTARIAREYQNVSVMDVPYNPHETTEGVHLTGLEQLWTALWFIEELGLVQGDE